jgi:hypothetical protein
LEITSFEGCFRPPREHIAGALIFVSNFRGSHYATLELPSDFQKWPPSLWPLGHPMSQNLPVIFHLKSLPVTPCLLALRPLRSRLGSARRASEFRVLYTNCHLITRRSFDSSTSHSSMNPIFCPPLPAAFQKTSFIHSPTNSLVSGLGSAWSASELC